MERHLSVLLVFQSNKFLICILNNILKEVEERLYVISSNIELFKRHEGSIQNKKSTYYFFDGSIFSIYNIYNAFIEKIIGRPTSKRDI
jgi:hypothetical protein